VTTACPRKCLGRWPAGLAARHLLAVRSSFRNGPHLRTIAATLPSRLSDLTFGLESYSPRVLALMRKGVRHGEIRRILDDCRRAGIAFNLQLFFGFPDETEPDARATIDFILDEMHGAATCSFGVFNLLRGSGVARNPDRFGIQSCESTSVGPCAAVDYAPVSGHASEMKQALRREMLSRIRYPHAAFSLTRILCCFSTQPESRTWQGTTTGSTMLHRTGLLPQGPRPAPCSGSFEIEPDHF